MVTRWGFLVGTLPQLLAGSGGAHGLGLSTGPSFSWHTVPVFAETSNVSGVFDTSALQTLAKFPLFVAEKAYDFAAPGFAEDKLATVAKQLKTLNPAIFLVFYYNANLDLTDYRLYSLSKQHAPRWWLRNASGSVFMAPIDSGAGAKPPFPYNAATGGVPVYDFTVPEMRQAWVAECMNVTSPQGHFDGCMVDRWTRTPFKGLPPGYTPEAVQAWTAGRDEATSALAAWARERGTYLVGEGHNVSAISDPGYGHSPSSLLNQLQLASNGIGLLASYQPGSVGQRFTNQLAMFLCGAAEGHYFGAGSWTTNHTSREGVTWHPEYDLPLGQPLSNATQNGHIYTRSFAYGTNVSFDMSTGVGTIQWGKFPEN